MKEFLEFLNTCETGRSLFYIAAFVLTIVLITGAICTTILQLSKMIIRHFERKQQNNTHEVIKLRAMLLLLNKISSKVPEKLIKTLVAEANDLRLNGFFRWDENFGEILFAPNKYRNKHPDFSREAIRELACKVHDSKEGKYELTSDDLFNIYACLCFLK
jgi:hypothetical protein